MRQKLGILPTALQRQILIQAGLSLLCLALAAAALVLFSITIAVPFLLGTALLAISAFRLYHIAVQGQYLTLKGVVLKVERTPLRLRPKALLLEIDGKVLHVVLRSRHLLVKEGEIVQLYIADTTPLYEWRGIHQLHAYLALTPERRRNAA